MLQVIQGLTETISINSFTIDFFVTVKPGLERSSNFKIQWVLSKALQVSKNEIKISFKISKYKIDEIEALC